LSRGGATENIVYPKIGFLMHPVSDSSDRWHGKIFKVKGHSRKDAFSCALTKRLMLIGLIAFEVVSTEFLKKNIKFISFIIADMLKYKR
jgi:hypothetical protein